MRPPVVLHDSAHDINQPIAVYTRYPLQHRQERHEIKVQHGSRSKQVVLQVCVNSIPVAYLLGQVAVSPYSIPPSSSSPCVVPGFGGRHDRFDHKTENQIK
jgi:hypothetical protein